MTGGAEATGQGSMSHWAKVTFPLAWRGAFAAQRKSGRNMGTGTWRGEMRHYLHPSPDLGRMLRCPWQGSPSSPCPRASLLEDRAHQKQQLHPYICINSMSSFTHSCSDGSMSGRLQCVVPPMLAQLPGASQP